MNPLQVYLHALRRKESARLNDEQLKWIADRYPYFVLPFATEAAAEKNDLQRRQQLLTHVAPAATDRAMLLCLVNPGGLDLANFYPVDAPATPSTDSAIDTFLSTYGKRDPKEEAILERLIFNPVADYSAVLEREAGETATTSGEPDEQDRRLAAFLASQGEVEAPREENIKPHTPAAAPAPESSLSESLAKIYIGKRRFEKAYEIISQLSLKNPEKSVYFADQLRFLDKLIRNQRLIDRRKANSKTQS